MQICIIELKLLKHELEVKAKVISGASGTWQYNYDPAKIEEFGIYAILEGELGGIAPEIDGHAGRFLII